MAHEPAMRRIPFISLALAALVAGCANNPPHEDASISRQALTDSDGDGLSDAEEREHGTDPNNPDMGGDGVDDGAEVQAGTDPTVADAGPEEGEEGEEGGEGEEDCARAAYDDCLDAGGDEASCRQRAARACAG